MNFRIGVLVGLFLLVVTVPAWAQEVTQGTLEHDGRTRTYWLVMPDHADDALLPLVLAFHPAGGDGAIMARITGFAEWAQRDQVMLVFPDGPGGYWDYGAGTPEWEDVPSLRDDPGFVAALLDDLLAQYPIDPEQIFAVGFSNGARMAFRVGCTEPRISAIAAVAASISDEVTAICDPDSLTDVIYFHGREDRTTPWEGKPLYLEEQQISVALSAPDTADFFAERNVCQGSEIQADGAQLYTDCAEESRVVFYGVQDGGHTWFREPDASALIWSFFGLVATDG